MTAAAPIPSLSFLHEPALVVSPEGVLVTGNAAARQLLAPRPLGGTIAEHVLEADADVVAFLRRASRTTSPTPGALTIARGDGPQRLRVQAARLGGPAEPLLVLRLLPPAEDQFSILSRRVHELDRQLRRRIREKEELEAALALNRQLLQELQHRVKNNIQIMMTLIRLSARGRMVPQVAEVVSLAGLRLQAMAASQEALYRSSRPGLVASGRMLADVVAAAFPDEPGQIEAEIADLEIPSESAHVVALIAMELLAGTPGRPKTHLSFGPTATGSALIVQRATEGAPDLELVRSLCEQAGGTLVIEPGSGFTASVSLPFGERRAV